MNTKDKNKMEEKKARVDLIMEIVKSGIELMKKIDWKAVKGYFTKTSILLLLLIVFLVSCKAVHIKEWTYETDSITKKRVLQKAFYSDDESFHFWSDGTGKTIEISPRVNGVGL